MGLFLSHSIVSTCEIVPLPDVYFAIQQKAKTIQKKLHSVVSWYITTIFIQCITYIIPHISSEDQTVDYWLTLSNNVEVVRTVLCLRNEEANYVAHDEDWKMCAWSG